MAGKKKISNSHQQYAYHLLTNIRDAAGLGPEIQGDFCFDMRPMEEGSFNKASGILTILGGACISLTLQGHQARDRYYTANVGGRMATILNSTMSEFSVGVDLAAEKGKASADTTTVSRMYSTGFRRDTVFNHYRGDDAVDYLSIVLRGFQQPVLDIR